MPYEFYATLFDTELAESGDSGPVGADSLDERCRSEALFCEGIAIYAHDTKTNPGEINTE